MSAIVLFSALSEFLRTKKDQIVRTREVLVERWDATYGLQDPATETLEYVDFDSLCDVIDEFSRTFEEQ